MKFFDIFRELSKNHEKQNLKYNNAAEKVSRNIIPYPSKKNEVKKTKDILLNEYKEYLSGYKKWSDNTKKTYFNALGKALKNQEFSNVNDIDMDKLGDYLIENTKRKNDVSKIKSSLKQFLKLNNSPVASKTRIIENIRANKPKGCKKSMEEFKVKNTVFKINALKNKKLKLGYRLMINSGLRISEISNLKKEDIEFCGRNRIKVQVIKGKGEKSRKFKTFWEDKYLYNGLKNHMKDLGPEDKIFYSASHIQNCSNKLGLKTHDFRKTFAQIVYYHYDGDKKKTVQTIQKLLGHNIDSKTYLIYLERDVNFNGTKYDI